MRRKSASTGIPQQLKKDCILRGEKSDYPLLVLPHLMLFPDNIVPLSTLSGLSSGDLKKARKGQLKFGVISRMSSEDALKETLAGFGTEAMVTALIKLPNGELGAIIKGSRRFILSKVTKHDYGYTGTVVFADDLPHLSEGSYGPELDALKSLAAGVLKYHSGANQEAAAQLMTQEDPTVLCNMLIPLLNLSLSEKLKFLGEFSFPKRLKRVLRALGKELRLLQISSRIQDKVRNGVQDNLKKSFLREQMQMIRKELGELGARDGDEVSILKKQLQKINLPEAVLKAAMKEAERLASVHPGSPEYMVSVTWLSWIRDLPWPDAKKQRLVPEGSFEKAVEVLNANHAGLDKVKDRILEFVAVLQHKGRVSGQILLLSGPPGVGKTTLGRSVAKALSRPYIRVSLGGVRDEAEIRGHRRTYIGAMPGKIMQAMKQAGSCRPVILLDEIDKLGRDGLQDLSSALLEVLDPEQNKHFTDHYLSLPYDLSEVLFIATANSTHQLSAPLLDRMELIELQGYTENEKLEIAVRHLIPRIKKSLSLPEDGLTVDSGALLEMIRKYTRESGVRQLNRLIEKIGRRVIRSLLEKKKQNSAGSQNCMKIEASALKDYLGNQPWPEEPNQSSLPAGVAVGLAYTSVGGDILYIESRRTRASAGKGELKLTGSLGQVMQESAQAVFSFLLSGPKLPGLDPQELADSQVHIHLPAGATPKDGPSAGVALLCGMASLFTGRSLREGLAMTGEITLRGQVLPVGGIREKLLAAHRYGRRTIILPRSNWKDLEELPSEVLSSMTLYPVESMIDALKISGAVDIDNPEDLPMPEVFKAPESTRPTGRLAVYH